MKARIKTTGETFDIERVSLRLTEKHLFTYGLNEVEILMPDLTPDYWTRLEHQYAGMAMQGLMSILPHIGGIEGRSRQTEVIDIATSVAHALVEKYKEKEK